jgi:hypothetical protein
VQLSAWARALAANLHVLRSLPVPAPLLSLVNPPWSLGVQTAGRTVMRHSARTCSYQAMRRQKGCPGPWVGESPESQPQRGDSDGVIQTDGPGSAARQVAVELASDVALEEANEVSLFHDSS